MHGGNIAGYGMHGIDNRIESIGEMKCHQIFFGKRILIVDDLREIRVKAQGYLLATGADIVTCNNGAEAMRLASEDNFDLIVMDLEMPILNGFEATQLIRRRGISKPIVAYTAHETAFDNHLPQDYGFNEVLTKSTRMSDFIAALAHVLEKHSLNNSNVNEENLEPIRSTFYDDRHIRSAFGVFRESLQQRLTEIDVTSKANGWDDLAKIAHKLKGSAACFGFPQLSDEAQRLETFAKNSGEPKEDLSLIVMNLRVLARRIELGMK